MQQPEFVRTMQDKVTIAGPHFFDQLNKILKKDHLQEEIDELFLRMKQEMEAYLNDLYSKFMYWTRHGMGSQLMMGEHIISEILFDETVVTELQELVLKGRRNNSSPMVSDGGQ